MNPSTCVETTPHHPGALALKTRAVRMGSPGARWGARGETCRCVDASVCSKQMVEVSVAAGVDLGWGREGSTSKAEGAKLRGLAPPP